MGKSKTKIEENIIKMSAYLIKRGELTSPLRLQKLLFFMHYEEIENKFNNTYFDIENNFQAWVNGPVNYMSYKLFKNYFWNFEEAEFINELLSEEEYKTIDSIYGAYFEKWDILSTTDLVDKSHKNKAWIEARGDLMATEPSNNFINEDREKITKFIDES